MPPTKAGLKIDVNQTAPNSDHAGSKAVARSPKSPSGNSKRGANRAAPYPSPTAALGSKLNDMTVQSPRRGNQPASPAQQSPRSKSKLSKFFSKFKKGFRWPKSRKKKSVQGKEVQEATHGDENGADGTDGSMTNDEYDSTTQHNSSLDSMVNTTMNTSVNTTVNMSLNESAAVRTHDLGIGTITTTASAPAPNKTVAESPAKPRTAPLAPIVASELHQESIARYTSLMSDDVVQSFSKSSSRDSLPVEHIPPSIVAPPASSFAEPSITKINDFTMSPARPVKTIQSQPVQMPSPIAHPQPKDSSQNGHHAKKSAAHHEQTHSAPTPHVIQVDIPTVSTTGNDQKKPKRAIDGLVQDMSEENQSLLGQMFGPKVVGQLQSQSWDERKEILDAAEASLWEPSKIKEPVLLFKASGILLGILLHDKTQPIVIASLKFLDNLIGTIGEKLDPKFLQDSLRPLVPLIISKSGSANQRIREVSTMTVQSFARHKNLGPFYISPHLVETLESKISPIIIQGRCALICTLLDEFKTKIQPFESFLDFAQPILEHPDSKARQSGIDVIMKIKGLTTPEQFKRLAMRLSMSAIKTLHISIDGSAPQPSQPAPSSSLPPLKMRNSVALGEENAFRANKNSVSWAINENAAEEANSAIPEAKKSAQRPSKGSRERRRDRTSSPATPTDVVMKRKQSGASRPSSKSSTSTFASSAFTQEEEEFMNDLID